MMEPLVIRPDFAGGVTQEALDRLADLLREEDIDVQVGYGEFPPVPPEGVESADVQVFPWFETLCIWFAQGAVTTLGGAAALAAVKLMRERFQQESDEGKCVRCAEMIEDYGEEGRVRQRVELESANAEPVVRTLSEFESYTRKKPNDLL